MANAIVLAMKAIRLLLLLAATGAGAVSLLFTSSAAQPRLDDEVRKLIDRSRDANAALMRGDGARWSELLPLGADFTLMSPFGGQPSHGAPSNARVQEIAAFFKNGSLEQELVQTYATRDMIVLALIERSRVEVAGLPSQDWALRVTLVYRREGSEWRLVHRHADPLVAPVSLNESAALARGDRTKVP